MLPARNINGMGGGGGGGGGFLLKSKIGRAEKRRTRENRSVSATNFRVALSNSLLLARSSELAPCKVEIWFYHEDLKVQNWFLTT